MDKTFNVPIKVLDFNEDLIPKLIQKLLVIETDKLGNPTQAGSYTVDALKKFFESFVQASLDLIKELEESTKQNAKSASNSMNAAKASETEASMSKETAAQILTQIGAMQKEVVDVIEAAQNAGLTELAQKAEELLKDLTDVELRVNDLSAETLEYMNSAKKAEANAKSSENKSKTSETNSKTSEEKALQYANEALNASDVGPHIVAEYPHQIDVNGKKFYIGFKVVNNMPQLIYKEVTSA